MISEKVFLRFVLKRSIKLSVFISENDIFARFNFAIYETLFSEKFFSEKF